MPNAEYFRDRRALRKLLGLCYHCERPARGALCDVHQKAQAGGRGRRLRKAYHCGLCGGTGHNARSPERCRE
jgi:hypothetical protein